MTNLTPAPADPTPAAPVVAKKKTPRWITPLLAGVAAIAIGLFGGILIGHNTASTSTTQAAGGGQGGFPGAGEGAGTAGTGGTGTTGTRGGFTAGTITKVDGDTITLKLTDGSTVKVTTGSDTTVTKSDDATVSDLATGDTISVRGTADSSGNVAATSVTEGALTGGFGGGTPPTGTGSGN